ncbi:Fe-S cluster assembly protein SufD [Myxococcota bacterium]|nr:Fe-S cluster assembly protein SufD [Myxococcota bacterium]MCZ7617758.1 Fe-S cluster assembly protein SufD [Myxococcota bacterium]
MSTFSPERHWAEAFAAAADVRAGEPPWLEATRKGALARFAELGVPARKHEEWKYTRAERIANHPWQPAAAASIGAEALDELELPVAAAPRLVFVNGRLAPDLSRLDGLPPGVVATNAGALLPRDGAWLEPRLDVPVPFTDRAFAALAVAMAPDAAVVRIPRDVSVEATLWVLFVSAPGEDVAASPRLIVEAEPGAGLRLVELHASLGASRQLHNALTEIVAGAAASVEHLRLQLEGAGTTHVAHVHARVARDARYASRTIALGAELSRLDLVVTLAEEGAEATLDGLYVAAQTQHHESRTCVDHQRPHGTSRELYKGVLAGRARGVFSGKVLVRKDAQKSSAEQKNENLLLSRDAEVDSKPQLEIEADDVRCTHGSTIGQLDEDALFYLRARGLDAPAARALLVRGFLGEILAGVEDEALRESLEARALATLSRAGVAAGGAP